MLENIEKPELDTVELRSDGKYGKFVLAPLERGYGITLGNSLRRVLLSSLPGVAVNSVRIDGVHHELSTIPGVKEDVSEIILNLKGLTAKLYGEGPKTIYIEKEGSYRSRLQERLGGLHPRSRHAHRNAGQGRKTLHGSRDRSWQRLCFRRAQQADNEFSNRCDCS